MLNPPRPASRLVRLGVLLVLATAAAVRPVSADCVFTTRPASAEEKKIYADGFALLQQIAPAAPAGWEQRNSPENNVLTEVCAESNAAVRRWGFSRSYSQTAGADQRRVAAEQQTLALMQKAQAQRQANEAKLAEVQKQMEGLMKKMQTLAAAQQFAAMEALGPQIEALSEQQRKLMGVDEMDAAMKATDAASTRDISATFAVTVGETNVDTSAFKPMTVPVGRGYRQEFVGDNGNPHADIMIVLPPAPGAGPGQTVVRISGDPARADALLKAAKLR